MYTFTINTIALLMSANSGETIVIFNEEIKDCMAREVVRVYRDERRETFFDYLASCHDTRLGYMIADMIMDRYESDDRVFDRKGDLGYEFLRNILQDMRCASEADRLFLKAHVDALKSATVIPDKWDQDREERVLANNVDLACWKIGPMWIDDMRERIGRFWSE